VRARLDGGARAILSPGLCTESSEVQGVKCQVYLRRLCTIFNLSEDQAQALLPPNKKPWIYCAGPDYEGFEGFFANQAEVDRFVKGLLPRTTQPWTVVGNEAYMPTTAVVSLGVDVSVSRKLALVFLEDKRRLVGLPMRAQTSHDLARVLAEKRPDIVAIDSPPKLGTVVEFDEARLSSHHARVCRVTLSALVVWMLAGPALAEAAIYGWHDAQGVAHYVSDPENVPSEYRARVVTVVRDIPVLPTSSPQEPPSPVDAPAPVVQATEADQVVETSFERGYRAGLAVAAAEEPGPWVDSIVQNVQIIEAPPLLPAFISPSSLFGPVLGRAGRFHDRRRFPPKGGGRFIQGPAGPPPLGAPGPPPVSFSRR
jgi:hypothetical protein